MPGKLWAWLTTCMSSLAKCLFSFSPHFGFLCYFGFSFVIYLQSVSSPLYVSRHKCTICKYSFTQQDAYSFVQVLLFDVQRLFGLMYSHLLIFAFVSLWSQIPRYHQSQYHRVILSFFFFFFGIYFIESGVTSGFFFLLLPVFLFVSNIQVFNLLSYWADFSVWLQIVLQSSQYHLQKRLSPFYIPSSLAVKLTVHICKEFWALSSIPLVQVPICTFGITLFWLLQTLV